MSSLGILGCGWLGVPLGKHLQTLNYNIKGSRTSESGVVELQKKGIEGYCVVLEDDQALGLDTFFGSSRYPPYIPYLLSDPLPK